jgi:sugar lactone lactonase YvrE
MGRARRAGTGVHAQRIEPGLCRFDRRDTNGVRVHAPNGDLLAFLHTPEVAANLCFGGTKRNRLFMTGSTSIYALYVNAVGAALS